jgi:two-component system cell cycle sensor histidine kinase/response regulator CckA
MTLKSKAHPAPVRDGTAIAGGKALSRLPWRIALLYAFVAALWIAFSDRILVTLVSDPQLIGRISMYKGWAFVVVTAGLLYGVLRRQVRQLERAAAARAEADRELREGEERYRSLFENMLNGFAYCRMLFEDEKPHDFIYLAVNNAFTTLTGLKDVIGKKVTELLPGLRESDPRLFEIYGQVARTGRPARFENYVEALEMWFEISVYSPEPGYFVAVFDVITERKQAVAALQESQEQFRQVVENINEVFWLRDVDRNQILYVSPGYREIWGRPTEDRYSSAHRWSESVHPEDRERVLQALRNGSAAEKYEQIYRIVRPDGTLRWIHDKGFPVYDKAGKAWRMAGVAEDITERKELEAKFFRAQRLESVGSLASGIAHDLNNILAPILMSIPLLRSGLPPEKAEKTFATIEASAERAAKLVKQLLIFGRGVEGRPVPVQPRELLQAMREIVQETFPKSIALQLHAPAALWPLLGDLTQLHQVLLNLCVNARDAMPQGGTLTLQAENLRIDGSLAAMIPGARPGPYLLLQVKDTGTGIPAENMDRIFDPYFTTKGVGEGTGLGLSTVLGIVKSHGGFVNLQSEVGKGSSFQIYLPAHPSGPEPFAAADGATPPSGNGELILLVDDEERIREVTRSILVQYGYQVVTACDGAEATMQFARQGGAIQAVITDLDMPLMDGIALIHVLRKMNPQIAVIISSGIVDKLGVMERKAEIEALAVKAILRKPYDAGKLLHAVHGLFSGG